MTIRTTALALMLGGALGLGGCQTGDMSSGLLQAAALVPTLDVSKARQRELGMAAAAYTNQNSLRSEDTELVSYLNTILAKLVNASDAPADYSYRIYVIEDSLVNAFTPGGGPVFVTTGLVRALETEAQMAAVLAHELGHITESHVVRGMRARAGLQVATSLGASAIGINSSLTRAVYDYSVLAAANGHGRSFETQADFIGLQTMIKAGYDPHEMVRVFEALARVFGDRSELANFFHGNHPTNRTRIATINRLIAEKYAGLDRSGLVRDTAAYRLVTKKYKGEI